MESRIRNVVFDLGGVLLNYNPRAFIESLGYGKELGDRLCDAIFYDPTWHEMDKGTYMTYGEAVPAFIANHPDMEDHIRRFFEGSWMDIYSVRQDSVDLLLEWAFGKGMDIYFLTNYASDGFDYVSGLYPFFRRGKGQVVSAHEKCVKPDPEIYRILLDRYALVPSETVFIDDRPENIRTAEALGIHGIVFTEASQVRRELEELIG